MSLKSKAMALARPVGRAAVSLIVLSLLSLPAYSFNWWHHRHNPPQLIIAGQPVLFTVLPNIDRDHVFTAPADFVRMLGAEFSIASVGDTLTVTGADGRTIKVPYTRDNDRCIVDVVKVAKGLGADVDWNDKDSILTLRARVMSARVQDGHLTVTTSYPVTYSTGALSDPSRIYIDISGAVMQGAPSTSHVGSDGVEQIRSKQLDFNTVRIALDMDHTARVAPAGIDKTSAIQVALGLTSEDIADGHSAPGTQPTATVVAVAPPAIPEPAASTEQPATLPAAIGPAKADNSAPKVVGLSTQTDGSGKLQVLVATTGTNVDAFQVNTFDKTADRPDRFALDIPASLAIPASLGNGSMPVVDPAVKSIRWGTVHADGKAYTRIVLDLISPMPYHVTSEPATDGSGMTYTIAPGSGETISTPSPLITPGASVPVIRAGNGSIKGLLIVVDPGHGGKDTGAPGVDGLFEKNLTLSIGKDLRDALVAAGANVLMTREDDTFIPLPTRSQIAIDNHADYFISVHCDSGSSRNAQEGSTVYYHGNNTTCRTLAMSIASRFNEASLGIKSDGVRTDYIRFPGSGFSVLRRAGEPAVLCECGYVNNDGDAKALNDPSVQKLIAASIVAGLKDFVGNKVASR